MGTAARTCGAHVAFAVPRAAHGEVQSYAASTHESHGDSLRHYTEVLGFTPGYHAAPGSE
jgi:hypothetical protein